MDHKQIQRQRLVDYINSSLADYAPAKDLLPITVGNYLDSLHDGVLLCYLVNCLSSQGEIIKQNEIKKTKATLFHKMDQVNKALEATKKIGLNIVGIRSESIVEKKQNVLLGLFSQITKQKPGKKSQNYNEKFKKQQFNHQQSRSQNQEPTLTHPQQQVQSSEQEKIEQVYQPETSQEPNQQQPKLEQNPLPEPAILTSQQPKQELQQEQDSLQPKSQSQIQFQGKVETHSQLQPISEPIAQPLSQPISQLYSKLEPQSSLQSLKSSFVPEQQPPHEQQNEPKHQYKPQQIISQSQSKLESYIAEPQTHLELQQQLEQENKQMQYQQQTSQNLHQNVYQQVSVQHPIQQQIQEQQDIPIGQNQLEEQIENIQINQNQLISQQAINGYTFQDHEGPQIVVLCGSIRKQSFNKGIINAIVSISNTKFFSKIHFHIPDLSILPLFNEDLEREERIPKAVYDLQQIVRKSSGLLIATPEYNGTFSSILKNAFDWLSRSYELYGGESPLKQKKIGILSCSYLTDNQINDTKEMGQNFKCNYFPESFYLDLRAGAFNMQTGDLTNETEINRLAYWYQQFTSFILSEQPQPEREPRFIMPN